MQDRASADLRPSVDAAAAILEVLPRLVHLLTRALASGDRVSLTLTQARLLKRLATQCRRVGELATELEVTPATASVAIAGLVRRGLVERLSDREDRRIVSLRLTGPGHAAWQAARLRQHAALAQLLDQLDESERRCLAMGLLALDRALDGVSELADERALEPAAAPPSSLR